MPCSKCGRTAKHEWWSFTFDRKTKEFYCPFCAKPPTNRRDHYLLAVFIIYLIVLLAISNAALVELKPYENISFDIGTAEDLARDEPSSFQNLTVGERLKLTGTINSSEERILYRTDYGSWDKTVDNFSLEMEDGNVTILLIKGLTIIYQFNGDGGDYQEFRTGDQVFVIGNIVSQNDSLGLETQYLLDQEPDVETMREVTKLAYGFVWLTTLLALIASFFPYFWVGVVSRKRGDGPAETVLRFHPSSAILKAINREGVHLKNRYQANVDFLAISGAGCLFLFPLGMIILREGGFRYDVLFLFFYFLLLSTGLGTIMVFLKVHDGFNHHVTRLVRGEAGILFYSVAREPLFLEWKDIPNRHEFGVNDRWLERVIDEALEERRNQGKEKSASEEST